MSAFFIAFWKGEERKIKSGESGMKTRKDFCIVFLCAERSMIVCRKVIYSVQAKFYAQNLVPTGNGLYRR